MTVIKNKRIQLGHVGLIQTGFGKVLIQLVSVDPTLGELVAVYPKPSEGVDELSTNTPVAFIFTLFTRLVKEKIIAVTGTLPIPEVPTKHRIHKHLITNNSDSSWLIRDNVDWTKFYVSKELTEAEQRYPIGAILNFKAFEDELEKMFSRF